MQVRRKAASALLAVLLLLAGRQAAGQAYPAGPQVLTFFSEVDDTDQPYALYLPAAYDPARKYPLVISLHGGGSNHRLNLRRVFGRSNAPGESDVEATRYFPELPDVDFIVASPLARGTMGYQGLAEKDVYDTLDDVKRRFSVDEDRVYLTGLSLGGGGTLWLALTRPDLWAAIAPVTPAVPEGAEELAPNALNLPVHLFQGSVDPVTFPGVTRMWVERLRELGTRVEYVEYPGVSHNSWENAYADARIFDWFGRFRRERFPERVRFVSKHYKYDDAYWVRLDGLTPGTLARIDARFSAPGRVEVATENLQGFTLDLAGHPRYSADRPLEVRLDGRTLRLRPGEPPSFRRQGSRWEVGRFQPPAAAKRKGLEGPMSEVLAERHVYVYGTGGSPSPEEQEARRAQAAEAADWIGGPRPLMVFPRVVADTLVRPSDLESANLVLFGTRETNRLIERYADRLPLHLDVAAAAEFGLAYVFPGENGRQVLVSSGLPWWTRTGPAPTGFAALADPERRAWRPHAGPAGVLMHRPDYLLFRKGVGNVLTQGYFDAAWRLPAEDARKLRDSGVVRVAGAR